MFNNKKIEAVERDVRYDHKVLVEKLTELYLMQRKIIDFIGAELKTMEAKTELVAKDKHIFPVCAPEEDLKAEKVELDKLENCFVCPKCNKHPIGIMWDNEKDCLEKHCECGYSWREDCLDKKSK